MVSGIVIEFGIVCRSERLSGIGNAPGIPAPHVGVRDEMTTQRRSIPYARDASFRAVQPDKYQLDLVPTGLGLRYQVRLTTTGKRRLDRKTHSPPEIVRHSFQNLPSGGDGCRGWIQSIQTTRYRIGVEQPVSALEIDGSRQR
jgi:hypothetical protein